MLNSCILIGRFNGMVNDNMMELKVQRPREGELQEYYLINVVLRDNIVENAKEYLKIDSVVGVKGTIKTNENKEIQIVANKISFLSSHN